MKNNMLKRVMTMVIAAILLLGSTLTVQASQYPDVNEDNWYYSFVMDVSDRGLMTGYSNGSFGATDKMTRGQFATILWRIGGAPDMGYSDFPDVPSSVFYSKACEWAKSNSVITGYSNGNFGGNDYINREQVATILYRYTKGEANGNIWDFPDGSSVSEFAKDGMSYAVGNGIIKGDNGYLNPQGNVVRAVAATMISRLSVSDGGNSNNENNGSNAENNNGSNNGNNEENNNGGSNGTDEDEVMESEKWVLYDDGELEKRNDLLSGCLTYCGGSKYPVVAPDEGINWERDISQVHTWRSKNTDVTVFSSFAPWDGDLDGAEPPNEWGSPYWSWCLNGQGLSLQEWMDTYLELKYSYELHDPYVKDSHIRLGIDGQYKGPDGQPVHFEPGEHPSLLEYSCISDEEVANRKRSGYPSVTLSDVTVPPVEGAILVRWFSDGYIEEYTGEFLVSYDIYGGAGQWANSMSTLVPDSHGNLHDPDDINSYSRLYWAIKK